MLNLKSHNEMTLDKFQTLNDLLSKLETQSVMIDFKTKLFNVLYEEESFCGYMDDYRICIGSIEFCTPVDKTEIVDVSYTEIGNVVSINIAITDGSLIKVYN